MVSCGRLLSAVTIVSICLMSFNGLADGQPEEPIGSYRAAGRSHNLAAADLDWEPGRITIRGPENAESLSVNSHYVKQRMGDFASPTSFEIRNGKIEVETTEISFYPFAASEVSAFSKGSAKSIRFEERPMWVSVQRNGDELRIDMDDGDTTGQGVFLNKEWLAQYRIAAPLVTHENGQRLDVRESDDGASFYFEMPHFSFVIVSPAELDARSKVGPVWIAPHDGDIAFDFANARINIDVPQRLTSSELWIEQGWIDMNIPDATPVGEQWDVQSINGETFYVIGLTAAQSGNLLTVESTNPWVVPCRTAMGANCTPTMESTITSICLQTACDIDNATTLFQYGQTECETTGCRIGAGEPFASRVVDVGSWLGTEWGLCHLLMATTMCDNVEELVTSYGYTIPELGLMGLDMANAGRKAGGETDDQSVPIPSSGAQTLWSEGGAGLWLLSMVPEGLPVVPGVEIAAEQMLSFVPNIADSGKAYQPTGYHGTNPHPNPQPWQEEPPTHEINDRDLCYASLLIAAAGVAAGLATGGWGLGIALIAAGFAIIACAITTSAGSWAAVGDYDVTHGHGGSGWEGEILNVPGIISLITSAAITDPLTATLPYGIPVCPCEGYYEQQQNYQGQDWTEREAAWTAHNAFREHLNKPATATIVLDLEVLTNTISTERANENFLLLGDTPQGRLFVTQALDEVVLECTTPCGSSEILSIESTGSGSFKPGEQETLVEFVGTPGEAVIKLLGVEIQGFTLDGTLNGDGFIPNVQIPEIVI